MENKDIAYSIGVFIEKYQFSPEVEIPDFGFCLNGLAKIEISSDSLEIYGEKTTFKGTALVSYGDGKTPIRTNAKHELAGNATIQEINHQPYVTFVEITQIKKKA